MQILASEVNEDAVKKMAEASNPQHQQTIVVENETQNVEECEDFHA